MKSMNLPMMRGGIEVGIMHRMNSALTGCTVILCRRGAVAGVDVGGARWVRVTDGFNPVNLVEKVHAAVLAVGSASVEAPWRDALSRRTENRI